MGRVAVYRGRHQLLVATRSGSYADSRAVRGHHYMIGAGLFVALGIAILIILGFLLWFVPHLLQQQALRSANEAAELRELIADMINEQEAVAMRQAQLGTSVSHLQDQVEQLLVAASPRDGHAGHAEEDTLLPMVLSSDGVAVRELEENFSRLQQRVDEHIALARVRNYRDNESWAYLLSLLATMQERLRTSSSNQTGASVVVQSGNSHEYHRHR